MQRHLAISTNPQDLEHHLLVIPGFSGNLTSCFLHFSITAKTGGQATHATKEEKGGSPSGYVQHFNRALCLLPHTQKNTMQNISSTKPLSWGHALLFTSLQVVTGTTNYLTGTTTLACSCATISAWWLSAASTRHCWKTPICSSPALPRLWAA